MPWVLDETEAKLSLQTNPDTKPATDKISLRSKSQFDLIHKTPLVAASRILAP